MLVIILGLTLSVLDSTLVNLALPAMARELQSSSAHTLWVVNSYQLASLVLPLAALGERLGYRRVYLVGMLVFSLASLAAMLATSLPTLVAARTLQGLGAAGVMSVNAALVRLIYPRALLGRGMAVNSLVVATASMAGPSVAAAILSVASWPGCCGQPAAGPVHAVAGTPGAAGQCGAGTRARGCRRWMCCSTSSCSA